MPTETLNIMNESLVQFISYSLSPLIPFRISSTIFCSILPPQTYELALSSAFSAHCLRGMKSLFHQNG